MAALMHYAARQVPEVEVSSEDLAATLFTSGTTDEPKSICLTHTNLVANALQTRHWFPDIRAGEEVFLGVMPLTYSYGMTAIMNIPIAIDATIVLLPVFELQQLLISSSSTSPFSSPKCHRSTRQLMARRRCVLMVSPPLNCV